MAEVAVCGLPGSGVELIRFGEPEFDERLRQAAAGRELHAYEGWLPYCVVVENRSGGAVAVTTVRAELVGADGRGVIHQMTLQHLDLERPEGYLVPGAYRFLSAVPQVDAVLNGGRVLEAVGRLEERRELYASQRRVTFRLDCVIWADGRVVGPDESRSAENVVAIQAAGEAMVRELAERRAGLEEAGRYLEETLAAPEAGSSGLADVDHFDRAWRQRARWMLLHMARFTTDEELWEFLVREGGKPRLAVRRMA